MLLIRHFSLKLFCVCESIWKCFHYVNECVLIYTSVCVCVCLEIYGASVTKGLERAFGMQVFVVVGDIRPRQFP